MVEESRKQRRWFQFSLSSLLILMLIVAAYLGGRVSLQGLRQPDLNGAWLMTLSSGSKRVVSLQELGDARYQLGPSAINSSGTYQFEEGQLVLVKPNHVGKDGFVWKLLSKDKLVLIAQPPTAKTGADYLGSTLDRQVGGAAGPPPAANRTVPAPPVASPRSSNPRSSNPRSSNGPADPKEGAEMGQGQPGLRASTPAPSATSDDLGGAWQLTLPAGFQRAVTLEPMSDGQYELLPGGLNFSGVYEIHNGDLIIVRPKSPELAGFRWQRSGEGAFRLIEQPTISMGANYVGATLTRPNAELPAKQ